ncbi:hypothetical protein R3P38DRAFT_3358391 [Favolaschia claudopus]|uniref:Uncharacterized protein n=1 Tax=Favolaschia claudopus TaxID=2862362 RepID=A0AAW0B4U5_9AGAR
MQPTTTHLVNGQAAVALHSPETHSHISDNFARHLGIVVATGSLSLFVSISVRTVAIGSDGCTPLFTHHPFAIRVAENLAADIVLGSDWAAICRAATNNSGVVFAADTYEVVFNIAPGTTPAAAEMSTSTSAPMQPAGSPAIPSALRLEWSATQTESAIAQTAILDTDHSTYNSFRGSVHTAAVQRSTFNVHAKQSDHLLESFIKLSLQEKNAVINYLVAISKVSADILRNMIPRHEGMAIRISGGKRKDAASLRADFGVHQCTKACLISESEAVRAGFAGKPALDPTELQESSLVLNLRSANVNKKRKSTETEDSSPKKARHSAESSTLKASFPCILPQTEKDKIISEFLESTSNAALKRYESSHRIFQSFFTDKRLELCALSLVWIVAMPMDFGLGKYHRSSRT